MTDEETRAGKAASNTSRRVLVVDDTPSVRILLKRALPVHGFEVSEAENATEGIEKARNEQPDVIVLDMQMPEISGAEAIGPLKEGAPNARILIYSSEDERVVRKVIDLGADSYFDKMGPISDMAAEINRLLEIS
jgi:two-component system KDP operon response regulator KdpE